MKAQSLTANIKILLTCCCHKEKKQNYFTLTLTALRNQGVGPLWTDVGWAMHVVREGRRMPLCVRMHMAGTHFGFGGKGGGVRCLAVLVGGDLGRQAPRWSIKPPTNHTPTHDEGGGAGGSEGRGLGEGSNRGHGGAGRVCAGPMGQVDG